MVNASKVTVSAKKDPPRVLVRLPLVFFTMPPPEGDRMGDCWESSRLPETNLVSTQCSYKLQPQGCLCTCSKGASHFDWNSRREFFIAISLEVRRLSLRVRIILHQLRHI